MKSTHYSEKVLDHFRHPRNTGTLKGEDVARGRVGNPVCGDLMEIYIKVRDERIQDIKFKTFGCGSAVATASMVIEYYWDNLCRLHALCFFLIKDMICGKNTIFKNKNREFSISLIKINKFFKNNEKSSR